MKKPREWWIEFGGDPANDQECYKRYVSGGAFNPLTPSDEVIHVIEKSAYDEMKSENERLKEVISRHERRLGLGEE